MELRIDPLTGVQVQVTESRQARPNRPSGDCPFCVGGTEAPEPYLVKAFTNRFPSFPDDRCEVVLYAPDHDARLPDLPLEHVRRVVDLWTERTAVLGARPDLAYVLVFENNGESVGATIAHPHGQIYAYPDVPALPATELARLADGHHLLEDDRPELTVIERDGWRAWVPSAPIYPYGMRVAPLDQRPDLPSLSDAEGTAFASVLAEALRRVQGVFDPPMPYTFWIHQRPFDGGDWPQAWMHVEIAGPHRAPGVMRYVAGAELGSGAYLNPVAPEDAAANLRAADAVTTITAVAPGRVNLIGDHTDSSGGLVLPLAIGLATTITGTRGGDRIELTSADEAEPAIVPLEVADPAAVTPAWARYVAGVVSELRPGTGFTGRVTTTLPVGAGLSSSAALEVAVALALGFDGTALELAQLTQLAEQRASGVPCGIMDQLASAAGVEGHALLIDCHALTVTPIAVPAGVEIRVIHSGEPRQLAGSAYAERKASVHAAEDVIGPLRLITDPDAVREKLHDEVLRRRARHVITENQRVRDVAAALPAGDLVAVGLAMAESHESLRNDFEVSTDALDVLVDRLVATPGVIGARLTGAGFGGCVVALTEPGALDEGWLVTPTAGAHLLS